MNEFGHIATIGNGICIDAWGAGPFVIIADDTPYRFAIPHTGSRIPIASVHPSSLS